MVFKFFFGCYCLGKVNDFNTVFLWKLEKLRMFLKERLSPKPNIWNDLFRLLWSPPPASLHPTLPHFFLSFVLYFIPLFSLPVVVSSSFFMLPRMRNCVICVKKSRGEGEGERGVKVRRNNLVHFSLLLAAVTRVWVLLTSSLMLSVWSKTCEE